MDWSWLSNLLSQPGSGGAVATAADVAGNTGGLLGLLGMGRTADPNQGLLTPTGIEGVSMGNETYGPERPAGLLADGSTAPAPADPLPGLVAQFTRQQQQQAAAQQQPMSAPAMAPMQPARAGTGPAPTLGYQRGYVIAPRLPRLNGQQVPNETGLL